VITYQALRVGETLLLPLPYEVTMEGGRRIAGAGEKAARDAHGRHRAVGGAELLKWLHRVLHHTGGIQHPALRGRHTIYVQHHPFLRRRPRGSWAIWRRRRGA